MGGYRYIFSNHHVLMLFNLLVKIGSTLAFVILFDEIFVTLNNKLGFEMFLLAT